MSTELEQTDRFLAHATVTDLRLERIKRRYASGYLVVEARSGTVKFLDGPVRAYLAPAAGAATLELFSLLRDDLRFPVKHTLLLAMESRRAMAHRVAVETDRGEMSELTILVDLLGRQGDQEPTSEDDEACFVVGFFPQPSLQAFSQQQPKPGSASVDRRRSRGVTLSQDDRGPAPSASLRRSQAATDATIEELRELNASLFLRNGRLSRENKDFKTLLDSTLIATMFLDCDLRIRSFTNNMIELFALRGLDIGRPITDLSSQLDYPSLEADIRHVLDSMQLVEREVQDLDREPRVFLMRMRPHRRFDEPLGVVLTFVDITMRKRAENQVWFLAHHDQLTGLANRSMFHSTVERRLASLAGSTDSVSLLCLDLDRFKTVNDTFGHQVGDTLLLLVARRLQGCVPADATVCRLGGDEFAIVPGRRMAPDDLIGVADTILARIASPYEIEDHRIQIGVSIGIASTDETRMDLDSLVRAADIALYKAKSQGRGVHRIFQSAMEEEFQRRRALESDLRNAIAHREFAVMYQPIVRLSDRKIVGAEALVRWQHPEQGLLQPASFISVAEETGLIGQIGIWVLQTACADAATWPEPLALSVNLSAAQFASLDLFDTISNVLEATGLPPHRLALEVTESTLLHDDLRTQHVLASLRRAGVSIAMDDFGTGYSSLSYIRNFSIQKIKIDQSFVQTIDSRTASAVIVDAIVTIGDGLGIGICAEGVETEQQLSALQQGGVREAQGYLLHRPMSADRFAGLLVPA